MIQTFFLITNLRNVLVNGVSTNCNALLLETVTPLFSGVGPSFRARGFGPDPAWEVFSIGLETLKFDLTPAQNNSVNFLQEDGSLKPIFGGGILQAGPQRFDLFADDTDRPIDVEIFEADEKDRIVLKVWDRLLEKVVLYNRFPNMFMLVPVRAEELLKTKKDIEFAMHTRSMGMRF